MVDKKKWLLAYVTGSINQELLVRNEYLIAENHILRSQIKGRLRLSDGERATLAEIAKRLGRKALQEIACIAKPDTILVWYRKLVAQKFDGSKERRWAGRPRVEAAVEELVVTVAGISDRHSTFFALFLTIRYAFFDVLSGFRMSLVPRH